MKSLQGKSGVSHFFSEVTTLPGGLKVVETHNTRINENDVIGFYAKVMDVEARSGELVAPSCTREAKDLARLYGIGLTITGEDSGTASVVAA